MTTNGLIDELDFVAYVDDELDADRIREIESWLSTHPDDAAKVHAYKLQNILLGSLHEEILSEPLPAALEATVSQPKSPIFEGNWMRIAATFLLVMLGGLAGWGFNSMQSVDGVTERKFVNQALKAHVVFVSGGPNVHETAIGNSDRLTGVYSRQFNHSIKVPNLAGAGFRATGRRLVNDKGVPTAQFMYKDPAGRMVTLYVQAGYDRADMTFRLLAEDDMVAFYWSDGPLAYALTGSMERGDLLDLARMVYEKLPRHEKLTN